VRKLTHSDYAHSLIWFFVSAGFTTVVYFPGAYSSNTLQQLYTGDGLFTQILSKQLSEGWIFSSPRMGYPFDSSFFAFPVTEFWSLVALKFLNIFLGSFSSVNVFYFAGFPLCFAITYLCSRVLNISRALSVVLAHTFTYLPFHFWRTEHTFYTWYFIIPIYFIFVLKITEIEYSTQKFGARFRLILSLFLLAGFGAYYSLFAVFLFLAAGITLFGSDDYLSKLKSIFQAIVAILLGLIVFQLPYLLANSETIRRSASDSETYGLKFVQMVIPRQDHLINLFANFTKEYNSSRPLVNENATSTLGFLGSLGFVVGGLILLASFKSRTISQPTITLSKLIWFLFFVGTIGGLGSVIASLGFTQIRAWNRISIFIAFGSLLVLISLTDSFLKNVGRDKYFRHFRFLIFPFLIFSSIIDTIGINTYNRNSALSNDFRPELHFFNNLESELPPNSSVYVFPYMSFPESIQVNNLESYSLLKGFLLSDTLKWSVGGMRGSEGDRYFESLSNETIPRQISVAEDLGFDAFYADIRGFSADELSTLTSLLGEPFLVSENGFLYAFKSETTSQSQAGQNIRAAMIIADYVVGLDGEIRYRNLIGDRLYFSRPGLPSYISSLSGLSIQENWGRWADARIAPTIKVEFGDPLPEVFGLKMVVRAFGPAINSTVVFKIGDESFEILLTGEFTSVNLNVKQNIAGSNLIEIQPPPPISPSSLGSSDDNRLLSIGLVSMQVMLP
jgi:phosphoglycerol transferase